jgi:predicted phage-related endonuclease
MSNQTSRRSFIGGSDARIIMGNDEVALLRLWQEKRGKIEPEDLSSHRPARGSDRGPEPALVSGQYWSGSG